MNLLKSCLRLLVLGYLTIVNRSYIETSTSGWDFRFMCWLYGGNKAVPVYDGWDYPSP